MLLMQFLAHRGFWIDPAEKNTPLACHRAFEHGFGIETDLRDFQGEIVISHDIPTEQGFTFEAFLQLYVQFSPTCLALNVKADGLQTEVERLLSKYKVKHYFLFDMSIPDTLGYLAKNLIVFTRHSEYEPHPVLYEPAQGVWLDEFKGHWLHRNIIEQHLNQGKKIAIVSPELHKRSYQTEWADYAWLKNNPNAYLCTDFPLDAQHFFESASQPH